MTIAASTERRSRWPRAIGWLLAASIAGTVVGVLFFAGPGKRVDPAELPGVSESQSVGDLALAQQRLVAYIVEHHRPEPEHVRTVVALAFGVASELRIDPLLVLAVIDVESSFDRFAQSLRGAQGLMQIHIPAHADRLEAFGGIDAAFDPHVNIRVGAELLRDHLLREGSTEAALKAYVGAARRSHDGGYGARVLRVRERLREVAEGRYELVMRAGSGAPAVANGSGS